jgi:putative flippase GtrA
MRAQGRAGSWFTTLQIDGLPSLRKFGRFLVVGLVNATAGFFLFLFFFSALGLHYLLANVLAFVTWVWFGFQLQRRWTFRAKASSFAFGKYLVSQIFFLGLGSLLLWTLVEALALRAEVAYLLTLGLVTGLLYLSTLLWVFGRSETNAE